MPVTSAAPAVPALDFLFNPAAVAVFGASRKEGPGFNGSIFVNSLLEIGFPGPIFLIHPSAPSIRGLKCYRRLVDTPDAVDYVISSVPAQHVPSLIEDCIAKGTVRTIHLFTAGFTETGDAEREKMQAAAVARARSAGIRIIGPNCMGLYVPHARIAMSNGQSATPGPVGMVSQSGYNAQEFVRYGQPRGLRFSKVISFGNGADLKAADFFDYFADDPQTEVVTAYLEGIQDGPRFAAALRKAGRAKPTIVLKGGRSEAGTKAASSHTASLAGSLEVFEGLCRQAGAIRVESMDQLVDAAVTFRYVRALRGNRVIVVGGGGGAAVLAADDLAAAGLTLPDLEDATSEALRRVTREAGTSIRNPVDSTSLWEPGGFEGTIGPCVRDTSADAVVYHTSMDSGPVVRVDDTRAMLEEQASTLGRLQTESGRPIVVTIKPAITPEGLRATNDMQYLLGRHGIASYPSIERAARALALLLRWQRMRAD